MGHLHDLCDPFRQMDNGQKELFLYLLSTALEQNYVPYLGGGKSYFPLVNKPDILLKPHAVHILVRDRQ